MEEPRFADPLRVEFVKDTTWVLISPFYFRSDLMDDLIVVPTGFVTDFASVPYKTDPRPAVVHDYLYSREDISQKLADEVFLEVMDYVKSVNWFRRRIRYYAVRMFGGFNK